MLQKKRYKFQSSLALPFWTAVTLCAFGAVINSKLLYDNIYKALSRINEEPIATVTFKYKTAQRKFLGRTIWDRLKQNSDVYNGDTIHTTSGAEATIYFTDGNQMELFENTMAQVFLEKDKKIKAELGSGFATFDTQSSTNSITLYSGGVDIEIQQGSLLSAKAEEENAENEKKGNLSVQVSQGSAKLVSKEQQTSLAEGSSLVLEGDVPKKVALVLNGPSANAKIVSHEDGKITVPFDWQPPEGLNSDDDYEVNIQVSTNKNFSDIVFNKNFKDTTHAEVELENGNYYWRLNYKGKSANGKIKAIKALPPTLITPVENFEYTYRNRFPAVRLIWTEVPYATAYNVEISTSKEMENPIFSQRSSTTSTIVQTLGEGIYYWRVTPFFTINREGLAAPSISKPFKISKKGMLAAPTPYIPVQNGIMNTQSDSKNKTFSWKNENDAEAYQLIIADNADLKNPILNQKVRTNYFDLGKNFSIADGKWYWAIKQIDSEGNTSTSSPIRTFFTMKGSPEQHTIEPISGYKVSKGLVRDMKFTWKQNLPANFESFIQISSSETFENNLINEKVSSSGFGGINLPEGTYYWRLYSASTTDEATLVTAAKQFNVVGNLAKANPFDPLVKAVARESVPYTFRWRNVEDADFYRFTIYSSKNEVVFEGTTYEPSISVNMFGSNFKDKANYRYEIQAKSNAIPGLCSRRNGELCEQTFYLIKLKPVEIITPQKNSSIKGDEAILNPPYIQWSSVDKVKKAQVVVRKVDGDAKTIILKNPSDEDFANGTVISEQKLLLDTKDGLRSGKYEIIVYATTIDGIDISNTDRKNIGTFTIEPIEKLPAPSTLSSNPQVFNEQYLRSAKSDRSITLSWDKVSKATDYFVEIKNKRGRTVLSENIKDNFYKINFLALSNEDKQVFQKGVFNWSVYAVRRIDTDKDGNLDKILQEGEFATGNFETDIPTPKKTKAKGASNPYGK